jgi:tetratricopeptide (TPR) repeat protein
VGVVSCAGLAAWLVLRSPARDVLAEGESAYRRQDWSRAALEARTVLKARPANPGALRLLARASARLGKDETAEAIYRRLGTAPMEAEDLFLLGRGLINRDQKGPGLAALGAARDFDPNHPETLDAVIQYMVENQSLTEAAREAERLMRQAGWDVRGRLVLARIRHELLEPAATAALLTEALERDPRLARTGTDPRQALRLLARCLLETNRPREASGQLEHVLELGPDQEAAWLLSRALLMEGKTTPARAAFEAAGEFARDDPLRHEPAPYVGASRCAHCHPNEYRAQQQSRHAQTIKSKAELKTLPWPESPLVDRSNPHVSHIFRRAGGRVEAEARVDDRSFAAVVEYALGSNHQGRSFVGWDREGQGRELRISHYPAPPEWDRTSEHPAEPMAVDGYLGRPIADESVRRCVHCHSTNFRAIQQPEGRPEAADHGIGCERCHGPGGHHLQAIETQFPDLAIARPRLASAAQVVALCAQCHKAPESAPPSKPNYIRFQAPTLVQSRCYTESGSLSCVTCHNPHRNASRAPSDYETICLQCHPPPGSPTRPTTEAAPARTWSPCPTGAERDCLSCHMPRIADAIPRALFTDHFIRIRRDARRP